MPRVLVGIIWRPQPDRIYAHDITVRRYRDILPDADVTDVDTDHDPFCRAACRNQAARLAEQGGYDVVVIGDADTLPEPEPLREAIHAAATDTRVHLPYTEYRTLGPDGTEQALDGVQLDHCAHTVVPFATSGVYVTTPATWWACGGQDERFACWAPEDMAWLVAHRMLLGDPVRHDGRVYALHHHTPSKTGPAYTAAVQLYRRYLAAADTGDVEAVRRLIAEHQH